MEDEPSGWRCRVDIFGQGTEAPAALFDRFHQVEQVAQGPSEPVILGDDHYIARP